MRIQKAPVLQGEARAEKERGVLQGDLENRGGHCMHGDSKVGVS